MNQVVRNDQEKANSHYISVLSQLIGQEYIKIAKTISLSGSGEWRGMKEGM